MRFYNQQHKYYCGIDLHARKMYVCILNNKGKVLVHQNIKTDPELFFEIIFPYIDDVAVGVECVFCPETSSGSPTGKVLQTIVPSSKITLAIQLIPIDACPPQAGLVQSKDPAYCAGYFKL